MQASKRVTLTAKALGEDSLVILNIGTTNAVFQNSCTEDLSFQDWRSKLGFGLVTYWVGFSWQKLVSGAGQ